LSSFNISVIVYVVFCLFILIIIDKNETELVETKLDIINNDTVINTITMILSHIETFIDQTSTTHLHIFLVIVGVLILLVSVLILVLCNKLLSNKTSYRSTQTGVNIHDHILYNNLLCHYIIKLLMKLHTIDYRKLI